MARLKTLGIVCACFSLAACDLETKNPFATIFSIQNIIFSKNELLNADGPEPMYLRVEFKNNRILKFYVGFPRIGSGMIGRMKCDKAIYQLINVLSATRGSKIFTVNDSTLQFDNFGIGLSWLKLLFDKPVLKNSLPERIYSAACAMPSA